jgi:hypothetical protein
MNDREENPEPINEMLFRSLADRLGIETIEELVERAEKEQIEGRVGVTLAHEEEDWSLAVAKNGISFKYYAWGPYVVSKQGIAKILQSMRET